MADLKPKVVRPSGVDGLLSDSDNLVLTNAPTQDTHGANKKYVDDEVGTEAAARISADSVLQDNIDAEEAARIAGDNALSSSLNGRIDQEISDREDADQDLQDQIDNITGGGIENLYVNRDGDNMTGNLTLNTDKVVLTTAGAGTFFGPLEAASIDGGSY